jgi:hypothetical protein
VHTVGRKADEGVNLDAFDVLVEDRTNRRVTLQILERLFHVRALDVVAPGLGGIDAGEVAASRMTAFPTPHPAQRLLAQPIRAPSPRSPDTR